MKIKKVWGMYKYAITKSKNGRKVYVNLIATSAGRYLSRQPYVIGLVKEVLSCRNLTGPDVCIERDMGRTIGNTDIVATNEKDTIFYAQPYKKTIFSRYVKNRILTPSHKLTIILKQDTDGNYEIADTWIGPFSPPFPGDKKATPTSKTFWQTHALVADTHLIQSKSITKVCPY